MIANKIIQENYRVQVGPDVHNDLSFAQCLQHNVTLCFYSFFFI